MQDKRPKVNSAGERELDKVAEQFNAFDENVKKLTQDHMNKAPMREIEPEKISQIDIEKSGETYLKPYRSISSREKFNETYRDDYNLAKVYVRFRARNLEIINETIDMWAKPFAGLPAEWWKIPCNKTVWAPRYIYEQLKSCNYHVMTMQQSSTGADQGGQYYGSMVADSTVQRLDAEEVSNRRTISMTGNRFA
jgi:hypothetical protein